MQSRRVLYHDVLPAGAPSEYTGFSGVALDAYNLEIDQFRRHSDHIEHVVASRALEVMTIREVMSRSLRLGVSLTVETAVWVS